MIPNLPLKKSIKISPITVHGTEEPKSLIQVKLENLVFNQSFIQSIIQSFSLLSFPFIYILFIFKFFHNYFIDLKLLRSAYYTAPEDQSAWFYLTWLLKDSSKEIILQEMNHIEELLSIEPTCSCKENQINFHFHF